MILGFTGTSKGMTNLQKAAVIGYLGGLPPFSVEEAHHGACVGADEDFVFALVNFLKEVQMPNVHARPGVFSNRPEDLSKRSEKAIEMSDVVHEAKTHFVRNRDIVAVCDVLLATPVTGEEQYHGGTWYTINFARRAGKAVVIVWPDGSVTEE